MKRRRAHISLKRKLAATLLTIVRPNEDGVMEPVIDYESAKNMTDEMIISLFAFDHGVLHAYGGPDEAWNLTPRPIQEHRIKTAKTDTPAFHKSRRLASAAAHHRAKMDAKAGLKGEAEAPAKNGKAKKKWPSRPMAGSRDSPWKVALRGRRVVRRAG